MGNGQSCKIVSIGDICLETKLCCKLLLKKVRHVLEIRLNLISIGQLDDEGYSNEFSSGRWKLSKGSLIVARGQKTNTLYRLRARHNSGQVNVAEDYPIELWHRRLGHTSDKDDHSMKVWAYPMRTKDQVIEIFKNFHVAVERETGMKLKCVRADNGGEYKGLFKNYCRTHEIKLEKTLKLSKSFRGEAIRTAVDLIDLTPSIALDGDVPQASVHIPQDERSKLDTKAKQCIFLDYAHEEFGYRFWDPDSRKIIMSRDVVFFEDQTIEDLQELENAIVSSPHEITIPVSVDIEHRVEEVLAEYEETMTGGEIPQVDDDVTENDTDS
ncbi:hypothetical protein CRG98_012565 [Punica granatum]|uniref:GAG-pre-integrase domain-containing protein n=1 Tax=Punica granatum TaxID=22663 RepID=A0A2I0KEU4_PUNGR|nr:hypothetical protein CRG98_012565 [Punica granatum]